MRKINPFVLLSSLLLATVLSACNGESNPNQQPTNDPVESDTDHENGEIDLSSGECPFAGTVKYKLNGADSWPADVKDRLTKAMDEAVWYYNCYSNLSHSLTVNYKPGVPTAEANVDGWMSFGSDKGYMVVATAMHEVGHTMGVGFYPWTELTDGNKHWTGAAVKKVIENIPSEQSDPGAAKFITADGQHFWPYGLNYAKEHVSEWSLINHVRIVAAMREDKKNY